MSKTKKDKFHRADDRKYSDGYKRGGEDTMSHRQEKRIKNMFRSGNMNDILSSFSTKR